MKGMERACAHPGALEGFEAAAPYLPQEPSSLPM